MISREKRKNQRFQNPNPDVVNAPFSCLFSVVDSDGSTKFEESLVYAEDVNKNLKCDDFSLDSQLKFGVSLNPVSLESSQFDAHESLMRSVDEKIKTLK